MRYISSLNSNWITSLAVVASIAISRPATHAQTGTMVWEFPTGGPVLSSPALGNNGVIYVGAYDEFLYAIDSTSGELVWKLPVQPSRPNQAAYIYSSPAIAADGTIYFGTEERNFLSAASSGNFYAVNPNGTVKWKFPVGAAIYSDPAIGSDGTVYFGCFDTNFYAVNPNGTLKWQFQAASSIFSDAAIALDGTIYFGCDDDNVYALNPNGTLKWKFNTGGAVTASPAIGPGGTIYIGTTSTLKLFALNPDGTKKWEFQAAERIYSSAAISADGTVFFGSDDGNLYALNPDGSLKWEFPTGARVRSSPALAADGTVYFGCDNGSVYALDSAGTLQWTFGTTNYVYSSPVIGPNGNVFIGSADFQLYAIAGSGSATMASAWPTFRHDALHTGMATVIADAAPTISTIADQIIDEDSSTALIAFTVSDVETASEALQLSGASTDATLVPPENITFGGSGSSRTVIITPIANRNGSATVVLTVADSAGNSATTSFLLIVNPINDPPLLNAIGDKIVQPGETLTIAAQATDPDAGQTLAFSLATAPAGATVDPATGVFTWTPSFEQANTSVPVTITVTDNGSPNLAAQASLTITVGAGSDQGPAIQSIRITEGTVTITWEAKPGVVYRVQYTGNIAAPVWSDLVDDVQADGSTASKVDATGLDQHRFYRVMAVP